MDFITYEIGKKLKDKEYPHGYNRFGYLPIYSDECTIKHLWDTGTYDEEYYGEFIPCPTISQVLKWLRNEKNIYCLPIFEQGIDMWLLCIERPLTGCDFAEYISESIYDTYEQAAIAGIDYVIDNLI
jgi:hypothetical protein